MWRFTACRRLIGVSFALCALFVCASSAQAQSQVGNVSETLTTSASVTALKNCKAATAVETNVTADKVAAAKNCKAAGLIETHVGADAVSGAQISTGVGPSENLTTSASVTALAFMTRGLTETLTTTPSVTAVAAHVSAITVILTTSDSCAASKPSGICRPVGLIETRVTTDMASVAKPNTAPNLVEVMNESDSVSVVPVRHAPLTENLTPSDLLLVTKCGALQEFLALTDGVQAIRGGMANASVNLTTTDALARSVGRSITENLTETDAIAAQKPGSFSVNVVNAQATSDSLAVNRTLTKALSETLTATAAVSSLHTSFAQLSENLTTADAATNQAAHIAALTVTLSPSDQLSAQSPGHLAAGLFDSLTTTGSVAVRMSAFRSLSDTLPLGDAVTGKIGPIVAIPENLAGSSSLVTATLSTPKLASVMESASVVDTISIVAPHAILFSESLGTTDTVTARIGRRRFWIIDSQ